MRLLSFMLALQPALVMAQWSEVPNAEVRPESAYGPTFGMLMAGPMVGYSEDCTYYSPSSGSWYAVSRTTDEWSTEAEIGGGGGGPGCCCVLDLVPHSELSVFFQVSDSWGHLLRSATNANGQWVQRSYQVGGGGPYPMKYLPISDSACLVAATLWPTGGIVFLTARSDSAPVFHDTLTNGWAYPRIMAFHSDRRGLLISGQNNGPYETWVTDSVTGQWTRVRVDSLFAPNAAKWFSDSTIWVVGSGGLVLRSIDGGTTWEELAGIGIGNVITVDGYSADSVWIGGSNGEVMVTGDAGVSWISRPTPAPAVLLLQVFNGAVYAHGSDGTLYRYGYPPSAPNEVDTWWFPSDEGGRIDLPVGEQLIEVFLFEMTGRAVGARYTNGKVSLSGASSGIYVLGIRTSMREERIRVFWPGQ